MDEFFEFLGISGLLTQIYEDEYDQEMARYEETKSKFEKFEKESSNNENEGEV